MDIFKNRMSRLFNISLAKISAKEFFLRYLLIEVDTSIADIIKIHEIEPGKIIKIGQYTIEPYLTTHMTGSLAFKLISTKHKLKEDELQNFNLPKGPLLGQLQRNGKIIFNNKEIKDSDVFRIEKTVIGYSSDTKVDPELLEFFKDSTILFHESSYFTDNDEFHTDSHSSLDDLVKAIANFNIKLFAPIHFSGRYKWEEIEAEISQYREKLPIMDIYAPKFGDLIYYDEKSKNIVIKSLEIIKVSF
jgi:ribonuclease Z